MTRPGIETRLGTNNLHQVFFIEHESILNRSVLLLEKTRIGTNTLDQSGPGNDGTDRIHQTPQISTNAASLSKTI